MNKKELTLKQQKKLGAIIFSVTLIAMGFIMWRVGVPLIKFASDPKDFRGWVSQHGFWGKIAFLGMVLLQTVVALIPGEPFEIAAGYVFGALEGTLLCIIANTIGGMLVFWLVRRFGIRFVELFFSKEKLQTVRFLKSNKKRDIIFFIVFMLPGTPKDLLCYFAGLTDINVGTWFFICCIGRIPSVITSTVGGDALGTKNYIFAIIVFAVTLFVSAIGLVLYNRIRLHREKMHKSVHSVTEEIE